MRCPTEGALLGSASPVSPPHWLRVSPIALVMSLSSLKSHRTVTSLQSRTGEAPGWHHCPLHTLHTLPAKPRPARRPICLQGFACAVSLSGGAWDALLLFSP